MKSSQFLLQASIVILIAFAATPSEADGKALKKWMDSARRVSVIPEGQSIKSSVQITKVEGNIDEVKQVGQITAAKCKNYDDLVAFTESSEMCDIDQQLSSNTNYLPWFPNKATFVLLDHSKWGNWYFTDPVSGCDIWIADREGGFEPLTIHINANAITNNLVHNLMYKQNLATNVLKLFNKKYNQEYTFIQRISYDYASDPDTCSKQKGEIDEYWNDFKDENRIPYVLYSAGQGFFYGLYDAVTATWDFVLKDLNKGDLLLSIDCSVQQSSCSIMQQ